MYVIQNLTNDRIIHSITSDSGAESGMTEEKIYSLIYQFYISKQIWYNLPCNVSNVCWGFYPNNINAGDCFVVNFLCNCQRITPKCHCERSEAIQKSLFCRYSSQWQYKLDLGFYPKNIGDYYEENTYILRIIFYAINGFCGWSKNL